MGRLSDELVFWEVPNIWSKYTPTDDWALSEFSIRSIENTANKTWKLFGLARVRRICTSPESRVAVAALKGGNDSLTTTS